MTPAPPKVKPERKPATKKKAPAKPAPGAGEG
jgi:hypothetical protein